MIIGKAFPHDSERLAEVQSTVYGQALFTIFDIAFREYRRAKFILGIRTDLELEVPPSSLDHRTLQWLHDALATQYRYRYIPDTNLFAPPQSQQEMDKDFTRGWIAFIEHEIRQIGERNLTLYRDICLAVFFPNPDPRGIQAEERLYELTQQCFENRMTQPNRPLDFEHEDEDYFVKGKPKLWLPRSPMTEMQRAVLAVPHPGQSPMTRSLLVSLLEDKLAGLIEADPREARNALEMSVEWAPEMYLIAQNGSPSTWPRQIMMSDGMNQLLSLIDWDLENRKAGPPPPKTETVDLLEIVETLA